MSDDDADDPKRAYKVGYRKPPTAHRFQPGQSGNRAGRPRRATSFGEEFAKGLMQPIATTMNGKRRRLTTIEIAVLRALKDVATGSPRALERWIAIMERYAPQTKHDPEQLEVDLDSLTDDQLRLLASIKLRSRAN